jgi:hypothetical protein
MIARCPALLSARIMTALQHPGQSLSLLCCVMAVMPYQLLDHLSTHNCKPCQASDRINVSPLRLSYIRCSAPWNVLDRIMDVGVVDGIALGWYLFSGWLLLLLQRSKAM